MEIGKYYVISLGNNLDESMTKEQIVAAIAEATGETPTHVDDAFITKLKEQNRNNNLKVWVGTQAEYNAITTPANDTLYVITDVVEYEEEITALGNELHALANYSTAEQQIGIWIDGKPIYRKTVDVGALPNATTKNVAHGITDFGTLIRMYGAAKNDTTEVPLPYVTPSNLNQTMSIWRTGNNIRIQTGTDRSAYSGYVTLEYTKA